jgi:hypothetical protein
LVFGQFYTHYLTQQLSEQTTQWPKDNKVVIRIEKEHTIQWPKEKVQQDIKRSTENAHKTKNQIARTPLENGVNSGALEGHAIPCSYVVLICKNIDDTLNS